MRLFKFVLSTILFVSSIATAIADGQLYYVNLATQSVQRANLDGSKAQNITGLDPGSSPFGIAFDPVNKRLYWADHINGTILRSDVNGKNRVVLISGLSLPIGITVVGTKIYFSEGPSDRAIRTADLDGGNLGYLIDPKSVPPSSQGYDGAGWITADIINGKLYWSDIFYEKVFRANIDDGSNLEEVVDLTAGATPSGLAVDPDGGYLYYCNGNDLNRIKLDKTNNGPFVTLPDACQGITVDSLNRMIYASFFGMTFGVQKININNKSSTTILTNQLVFGVAIDSDRAATPVTVPAPPVVMVQAHKVTIVMEEFSFGALKAIRAASKKKKKVSKKDTKLNVVYESTVTRTNDNLGNVLAKKDVTRKKDKRNVLTLKNVKPGKYTSKYRVLITDKKGKVVAKTKDSPLETFEVF